MLSKPLVVFFSFSPHSPVVVVVVVVVHVFTAVALPLLFRTAAAATDASTNARAAVTVAPSALLRMHQTDGRTNERTRRRLVSSPSVRRESSSSSEARTRAPRG
jgi:hypothetical protein